MDCNLSGSSVSGILQARVLEWVAISSTSQEPKFQLSAYIILSQSFHWSSIENAFLPIKLQSFVYILSYILIIYKMTSYKFQIFLIKPGILFFWFL